MSDIDGLISKLLNDRGIIGQSEIDEFFHPTNPIDIPISKTGINQKNLDQAVELIQNHLSKNHPIFIYGDYDVDGITGTAILWETLYQYSNLVFPHIPHRQEEGYGLSQKGIDHCLEKGAKLIITVDNGIVAHDQIAYCRSKGCDLIVIDHHTIDEFLPNANVIVHTTSTSAAGVAWFFSREFMSRSNNQRPTTSDELLSLVAISVICDMVPLLGINRSFAKYGIEQLNNTNRPGLQAIIKLASIKDKLNSYHIGFLIGPRLNAPGRLEHAIDSLRLLCTKNVSQAETLAEKLNQINQLRQDKTQNYSNHALNSFTSETKPKLLISYSPDYDEGVIGLIAAKLVEAYYRPSIAISVKDDFSKGSARSVSGFDITNHLRKFENYLTAVGGHPMAAGFTLPTSKLADFINEAVSLAEKNISDDILIKNTRVDAVTQLSTMNYELITKLSEFEPFGLGNPRPVFQSLSVPVSGFRRLGNGLRHLKFTAGALDAIYFNAPVGVESDMETADIIYTLDLNIFNGKSTLQLVIKVLATSDQRLVTKD